MVYDWLIRRGFIFIISGFIMCHATANRTITPVAFLKIESKELFLSTGL